MTHLGYCSAEEDKWTFDLKLEGFAEEHIAYWQAVIQREMMLFLLLYPDMNVVYEEPLEE